AAVIPRPPSRPPLPTWITPLLIPTARGTAPPPPQPAVPVRVRRSRRPYYLPPFLRAAPLFAPAPAAPPFSRPAVFARGAALRVLLARRTRSTTASGPGNISRVCPSSNRTR